MKHLLEHFKDLSIHPKNAAELKGLILQLAVQGKLTASWRLGNPDVEPASVLLKRIQAEKVQLINEKKIKNDNPLSKITTDEIPYKLPESWIWCRLGHSGYTQTGSTPPKNNIANYGDFIPFLGPADISNDWMKYPVDGLSELGISNGRLIPKESLMMVCIGGSIGKCNVNDIDVSCNQQINTVTSLFMPIEFVKLTCQSPYFQKIVLDKSSGSATPIINKGKWEMLPIPLPPLEEQKVIVSIINILFAEVEQLEALTKERIQLKEAFVTSALQQLANSKTINGEWAFLKQHFPAFFTELPNIKKLRESILQLAVQGKLTTHWRKKNQDTEDASVLLERIKEEKAQRIKEKKIKKEKPLPAITADEIPYELPEGWVWCRMQEVGLFERGKSKHRPRNDFRLFHDGEFPLVQTGDVSGAKKNGGIINTHKSAYNDFGLAQSRMWDKGTLCITIAANIAETGFLGFDACFPDSVVGFTTMDGPSVSNYVEYFITVMKSDLEKYAPSTAQKNINLGILYELKFPLPPVEEQKAIVEKVNTLMALCEQLEQEIQSSKTTQEDWMKSSLREVFEGEKEELPLGMAAEETANYAQKK